MNQRSTLCVLFLMLAIMACIIPDEAVEDTEDDRVKSRQKRLALPAIYYGAVISYELFAILAATYSAAVVSRAISRRVSTDSHTCANNRGWCRDRCFRGEYVDWQNSPVCGNYRCCRY